ncbi:MAG: hypothetical protein V1725_08145 [archaeon]
MKSLKTILTIATAAAIIGCLYVSSSYLDLPGFSQKVQQGRTKNSIATIVTGIAAQQAYGNSRIDMNVGKTFYPDAKLTGSTTPTSIHTHLDLALTDADFHASNENLLQGKVEKSEFNWNVQQTGKDEYEIRRWGPKPNNTLKLHVADGIIIGEYTRWFGWDWNISGKYDSTGKAEIDITAPLTLGLHISGTMK